MIDLSTHDWSIDRVFDGAVTSHGFAPYMRDYDVIFDVPAARPDGDGSYVEGRYRYRFTHCVEASTTTNLPPEAWQRSWSDAFIDARAWQDAGEPAGFVWGVEWADAYPGVRRVASSEAAGAWSRSLGKPMHTIELETNAYVLRLVCHDLRVTQLAAGDPVTGELRTIT